MIWPQTRSVDAATPILELTGASVALPDSQAAALGVDCTVRPGDLVLVHSDDVPCEEALVDVACGLSAPLAGAVRFIGMDWSMMPPEHANAMRGRIGRVFRRGEWIPYLSLADNMLYGQLYHTHRSYVDARDEAVRIATSFGLPGLPVDSPDDVSELDRRRAAHARAFLGEPNLIIIESPARGLEQEIIEPLVSATLASRNRHAAVLWFTPDRHMWSELSPHATQRLRLGGNRLLPIGTGA